MSSRALHVLFLGTSPFAVPSLKALAADPRFSIDTVITQPDMPVGRKQILTPPPVKETALALGLPILQPKNLKEEFETLNLERPDFLVVVSYGQILSQEILDLPRIAPVNVHASLLPHWRGASPLQHAILAGDAESGVTIQRMVKELDAGPILAQERMALDPRETFPTLHDRLAETGARLLVETLINPLSETPQREADATLCKKLAREDGFVDPTTMTAEEIDRKVRALNPWPGATWKIEKTGELIKLLETSLEPADTTALPCKGGDLLYLVTIQPAGKKPMNGAAWERGKHAL